MGVRDREERDREEDRQTDRQTDRPTDRQTDREEHSETSQKILNAANNTELISAQKTKPC